MDAKVIKHFTDKHTRTLHKAGEKCTVSQERYEEINSTALGFFLEEIKKATKKKVR